MKDKFSWKAFISIGLTYIIILLLVTGIVLYQAPSGRVAHWVNWKIFGLTKEQWQSVHTVFSFLFVILSVFHLLVINWKPFWSYLKKKTKTGLNKKRELYLSTVLILLIFLGVIYSVPPFGYIHDLGEKLTQSWEKKEALPPVPHAEEFSLNDLAEQDSNLTIENIIDILRSNDISYESAEQTLAEIGDLNKQSPDQIYHLLIPKHGTDMRGGGGGYGRKTIEQAAIELNKDIDAVLEMLEKKNIITDKNANLRSVAMDNNMSPADLYDLIKEQ